MYVTEANSHFIKGAVRRVALGTASVSALLLATLSMPALAQTTSPQDVEQVVVSASRVVRDGYQAPTPTTVLGSADIENAAQANMFSYLSQLPALGGNVSTQAGNNLLSNGVQGIDAVNLRGLGTNRTLVLLDGRRTVGSSLAGVVDVSQIPQALISRVDVVTGGASAAWGSDAVGGVVNFVLNKTYTGLKGELETGETTYGDDRQDKLTLTWGASLFGGRGHLLVNAEADDDAGTPSGPPHRPWYHGTKYVDYTVAKTPAGSPEDVVAANVGNSQMVDGGLITAGPLKGIAFGAGGTPYQFQYGTVVGAAMIGGQWQTTDIGDANLDAVLRRQILYSHFAFDVSDNLTLWVEGAYANVVSHYAATDNYKAGTLTIQCDNAFLPASITAACATNQIPNFAFGTLNVPLGLNSALNTRDTPRVSAGADGRFSVLGKDWTWDLAAGEGSSLTTEHLYNDTLTPRYLAAIDDVRTANGSIVCRSAAAQADGCVPLDIIGTNAPSAAAENYVLGTAILHQHYQQKTASISFNGEPFDIWDGPVSVAFGGEYRQEKVSGTEDCASIGNCGNSLLSSSGKNWMAGNFSAATGGYDVKEGFVTAVVPLVRDLPWAKAADLEVSGRLTDYSRSGVVTTWKVGFTYDVTDDVRLRGTRSQDIRAPNLQDLFNPGSTSQSVVTDLIGQYAGQTYNAFTTAIGNPNLKPEVAQSSGLGVVFQPHWVSGLAGSIDYYDISISNGITSLSSTNELTLCAQGNQTLCALIARDATGHITYITTAPVNFQIQHTMGYDYEASYRTPISNIFADWEGDLTARVLATNVVTNKTTSGLPGTIPSEAAGVGSGPSPRWRLIMTEQYEGNSVVTGLTERFVSAGVLGNNFIQCTTGCPLPTLNNPTINSNYVSPIWYFDYTATYKFLLGNGVASEAYFRVDNLLNKSPPVVPSSGNVSLGVANVGIYDNLGRFFRIGLRFNT